MHYAVVAAVDDHKPAIGCFDHTPRILKLIKSFAATIVPSNHDAFLGTRMPKGHAVAFHLTAPLAHHQVATARYTDATGSIKVFGLRAWPNASSYETADLSAWCPLDHAIVLYVCYKDRAVPAKSHAIRARELIETRSASAPGNKYSFARPPCP